MNPVLQRFLFLSRHHRTIFLDHVKKNHFSFVFRFPVVSPKQPTGHRRDDRDRKQTPTSRITKRRNRLNRERIKNRFEQLKQNRPIWNNSSFSSSSAKLFFFTHKLFAAKESQFYSLDEKTNQQYEGRVGVWQPK